MTPAAHAEVPESLHGPFAFQEVQKKKKPKIMNTTATSFFFFWLLRRVLTSLLLPLAYFEQAASWEFLFSIYKVVFEGFLEHPEMVTHQFKYN